MPRTLCQSPTDVLARVLLEVLPAGSWVPSWLLTSLLVRCPGVQASWLHLPEAARTRGLCSRLIGWAGVWVNAPLTHPGSKEGKGISLPPGKENPTKQTEAKPRPEAFSPTRLALMPTPWTKWSHVNSGSRALRSRPRGQCLLATSQLCGFSVTQDKWP